MSTESDSTERFSVSTALALVVRGSVMGVAEILPGISGGTVALLLGIYERMVIALADLTIAIKNLASFKWSTFSQLQQPLGILLPLFSGMLVGAILTAITLKNLLDTHALYVFAVIFGVVVAASCFTFRESQWRARILFIPCGLLISLPIGLLSHSGTDPHLALIYVGGVLAFGAWILPGISGSLILLILGVWSTMLTALVSFDLLKIGLFGFGLVSGWLVFSQPVRALLGNHRNEIMALFTGLLLGSLLHIWPWQLNKQPVLPHEFDGNPAIFVVSCMMVGGFLLVWILTYVRTRQISH
ncbi:MAG: DUF368 domain-containing protein [Gammaproteobacteria bacterium]|nr:DUF368 domain-containing protein [Gammaproteobacteria bacterium]MDE0251335.1 DUF368 domain-containing protein [Gammaproteobacteria bacterium]